MNGARNERCEWMSILAQARLDELASCVETLGALPSYRFVREPQTGLVMIRGRAGGTGAAFNLGEMTVTRCTIALQESELAGHAHVGGRKHAHAELAALCDALLQDARWHARVRAQVLDALASRANARTTKRRRQTAATKVDFFTLVRGEG